MTGENEQPELPTFIKAASDQPQTPSSIFELFDFWAPDRLGDDAADYAAGRRHFATAIAYSKELGSNLIIANIVAAMRFRAVGPIELGFIDELASKATFGRVPPPISAIDIEATIRSVGTTEDEMRHGKADAASFLEIARSVSCVEVISGMMIDAIKGEYGYGTLTFLFTVCAAAQAGMGH